MGYECGKKKNRKMCAEIKKIVPSGFMNMYFFHNVFFRAG